MTAVIRLISRVILLVAVIVPPATANEDALRVGVLEFGTVNWELDVMQHRGLARREQVSLEVLPFASKEAASIAMQADSVDVIVTDWFWVSRQRYNGEDYVFVPHSLAIGGVMTNPAAGISDIADLAGRRIGVAGGPDDKSWLLLRAWTQQTTGDDIAGQVEVAFGAPPLLNQLLLQGELDAVLNFWHYNARLRAAGMQQLVDVEALLPALGIETKPPLLGWVFRESFAAERPGVIAGFLRASQHAKQHLLESDAEWQRLRPLMQVANDAEFAALRDDYRDGIPRRWNKNDIEAASRIWSVVAAVAGDELTGGEKTLAAGTFWKPRSAAKR